MDLTPAQPKIFDPQTGAPISLPHEEIGRAVASGKATFLKGDQIPVINPDGQPGTIPAEQAVEAFKAGFTYEPVDAQALRAEKREYGDGVANEAKALAAGAARGLTFGASDYALTRTGAVDPETLSKLEKYNPGASLAGNVAGAVLPTIFAPEAVALREAATALQVAKKAGDAAKIAQAAHALEAAEVAAKTFRAGDVINAPFAATKVAARIGDSVAEKIGAEGAKTLAQRIVAKSLPKIAGSAVEGAAYGAGNVVSEAALGDPDLSAEKIMGEVGLGAIIGGGLGGVLGIAEGVLSKPAAEGVLKATEAASQDVARATEAGAVPLTEAELAAKYGSGYVPPADGTIEHSLDQMKMSAEQKAGVIEGLQKLKPHADEIVKAAEAIDAPVLESQISASEHVHRIDSMLMTSPTPVGVARQQLFQKGFDAVESSVSRSLGDGMGMSQVEVGNALKKSLSTKVEAEVAPINALYEDLKQTYQAIPVSDRSTAAISRNIMRLEDVRLSPSSAQSRIAKQVADEIQNLKTVDEIKRYKSLLRQSLSPTASPAEKHIVGEISEKLTNLEESTIIRLAKNEMKTPAAKERIMGLLEQRKVANGQYKELMEKLGDLGEAMGKRRVRGAGDFLSFLDDMTPEALAKKLFAKNNSEFLQGFSKAFPEEMRLIAGYQKSVIRDAAMHDGRIMANKVFRELDKLSPEVKSLIFNPAELSQLKAAQTYMEAMPKNFNPSGTSMAEAYRRFFENPIKAFAASVYDKAAETGMKAVVKTGGADASKIQTLIKLEKIAQQTSATIRNSVKAFTSQTGGKGAVLAPSVNYITKSKLDDASPERRKRDKHEMFNERYAEVTKAVSNPEYLTSQIAKSTEGLGAAAPKVAQGLMMNAVKASQFLYSKAPKDPNAAYGIMGSVRKWQPAQADMSRWERYVTAVDNPMTVLKDFKQGTLTTEGVETLKTIYPRLYQEIVGALTEELSELKHDLPFQKRLQLATFFDLPVDQAFTPEFIAKMQAVHAQATQGREQAEQGINMSGSKFSMAKNNQSEMDRLSARA